MNSIKENIESKTNVATNQKKHVPPLATMSKASTSAAAVAASLSAVQDEKESVHDDVGGEMDYSLLDDDQNQFEPSPPPPPPIKIGETKVVPKVTKNDVTPSSSSSSTAAAANFDDILSNWDAICKMNNDTDMMEEAALNSSGSSSTLDATTISPEEDLKMWFWDAWSDPIRAPGQVYLFGKVPCTAKTEPTSSAAAEPVTNRSKAEFKSMCVRLEKVERCVYLLPHAFHLDPVTLEKTKRPVTFVDVYEEFKEKIAPALQLESWKSKKVTKNFAFLVPKVNVPSTGEYFEVSWAFFCFAELQESQ